MFHLLMILILTTCIAIVSSIYYNTISLQKTYGTANSYYGAYYGAVSSIERWLLMSKLKYPSYVWSWWFRGNESIWADSNTFSGRFWRLNQWENSMIRSVDS